MSSRQIDNVTAGYVFACDAASGEVLWTYRKIVEVARGCGERPARITDEECARVRAEAARVFRDCRVEALIAPEGLALAENVSIRVDPATRALCEQPVDVPTLGQRFADRACAQSERPPGHPR